MDVKQIRRKLQGSVPRIGMRIIKTAVGVFICFVVNYFRGFGADNMTVDAAITAVICMQQTFKDTKTSALNRFAGTLTGAVWGFIFLALLTSVSSSIHILLSYGIVALGVIVVIYTTVLFQKAETAALSTIVFLCVAASFSAVTDPFAASFARFIDVALGTIVAFLVNLMRLPRKKNKDCLFFVRTKDLAPDTFKPASSSVIYQLKTLYSKGAKVCLISDHAPAFISMQISSISPTVPQIVMDGAAIYDASEDNYLWKYPFGAEKTRQLKDYLDSIGCNYFITTVHRDKTCLFHFGKEFNEQEQKSYENLKKSPYRRYMREDMFNEAEAVSAKIVNSPEAITKLENSLFTLLPADSFRIVRRSDHIYIYDAGCTLETAKDQLLTILNGHGKLTPVDVFLPDGYKYRNDALHVLKMVERKFERIGF